ncbi:MAG: hypothetical protein JWP27_379 [Flaviaesturariibacter sp.]|nr:hypothetical protein [Flaviaesturariibacter sp.]
MRVLLLSQYLPPLKNISAVRITEVANQFTRNGYEVIGFSTNNHRYELTDHYALDPRVRIVRTNSWDFLIVRMQLKAALLRLLGKSPGTAPVLSHDGIATRSRGARMRSDFFAFLANYLPFSLLFGPGSFIYILRTFFKCLSYVEQDTIIFSSFRPYSDHLIAWMVKKARPRVTWICDFRDPHLPPNATGWFFQWHAWLNRRLFRRATVITTVSHGIAKNLQAYNKTVRILRNGIVGPLDDISGMPAPSFFSITYTGMLYEGTRDPSLLFERLSALLDAGQIDRRHLRLVYAGKDHAIWNSFVRRYGLEDVSEAHGQLPMAEAKELQSSTCINLLLTWADRNYKGVLTGKMYEYFKAQKPIITLINGEHDEELEAIMRNTNAGPVLYQDSDPAEINRFLLLHYEGFLKGATVAQIRPSTLAEFQWDQSFPAFLRETGLPVAGN